MDSIAHPVPIAFLPLLLNFFVPGLGLYYAGYYGPNGRDWKCYALGWLLKVCYIIGVVNWYWLLPPLLSLISWIIGMYIGYLIYKKSKTD